MNSSMKSESRSQKRMRLITYIYQEEVLGKAFDTKRAFEQGDFSQKEIEILEHIEKNLTKYKAIISKFLVNNWHINRLPALERAILIFGAFELRINDKKIVINELINLTKFFVPGDAFKYINKVLDKVGEFYEQEN